MLFFFTNSNTSSPLASSDESESESLSTSGCRSASIEIIGSSGVNFSSDSEASELVSSESTSSTRADCSTESGWSRAAARISSNVDPER